MTGRLLLSSLLLSSLLLFAQVAWSSSYCLEGEWQLDENQSDNLQRIRDKLAIKEKMKQKALYQQEKESEVHSALPAEFPDFVFGAGALSISFEGPEVVLRQGSIERRVNTDGQSQPSSLKNLDSRGGSTVAGWEEGVLVIDTSTQQGMLIEERYRILAGRDLQILVRLLYGESTTDVGKVYRRLSRLAGECDPDRLPAPGTDL